MFAFPGAKVRTLMKGDTVEVPNRYVDVFLKQKGGLFSDKPPSVKKELKESETKEFTGGVTKSYPSQFKKKRK